MAAVEVVGVVGGCALGGCALVGCALVPGGGDLRQREAEGLVCRYFRLGPDKFELALVFKDEAL